MNNIRKYIKKWISILLVIVLVNQAIATPSYSAQKGIFFSYSTAQRLKTDLDYYKQEAKKTSLYKQELELCDANIFNLEEEKNLFIINEKILKTQKEEYKKAYLESQKNLMEEVDSKPSRLTWASIGAVSTILVVIIGLFAFQK